MIKVSLNLEHNNDIIISASKPEEIEFLREYGTERILDDYVNATTPHTSKIDMKTYEDYLNFMRDPCKMMYGENVSRECTSFDRQILVQEFTQSMSADIFTCNKMESFILDLFTHWKKDKEFDRFKEIYELI